MWNVRCVIRRWKNRIFSHIWTLHIRLNAIFVPNHSKSALTSNVIRDCMIQIALIRYLNARFVTKRIDHRGPYIITCDYTKVRCYVIPKLVIAHFMNFELYHFPLNFSYIPCYARLPLRISCIFADELMTISLLSTLLILSLISALCWCYCTKHVISQYLCF